MCETLRGEMGPDIPDNYPRFKLRF